MENLYILCPRSGKTSLKGPFDLKALQRAVEKLDGLASDFIFQSESKTWVRLYKIAEFKKIVLSEPSVAEFKKFETQLRELSELNQPENFEKTTSGENAWFFRYDQMEFGPFTTSEIEAIIQLKKLKGHTELWHHSSQEWFPEKDFSKFVTAHPSVKDNADDSLAIERGQNKRVSQRSQKIATAWCMVEKKMKLIGICANISDTGMQIVHTKSCRFKPGQRVRFFIDPIEVTSFWAIGTLARIIPSVHKAAFHFDSEEDLAILKEWLKKVQRRPI